jgi:hypothetical protein
MAAARIAPDGDPTPPRIMAAKIVRQFGDPDLHGGQQHAPLMAVEIRTSQ